MLAMRVRQKDATFYLVCYRGEDILRRVKFLSRHYTDAGEAPARTDEEDVASFIRGVEKSDGAFQRGLVRRKVKAILNFYETASAQPLIPGPVLLFTPENLDFRPFRDSPAAGNLSEPEKPFIIIDGQHRLAGLELFAKKHPEDAATVDVPAIIFDGRQEDFAAEMFVIINSTHTRINKSHLVDLMEKVTFEVTPEKRWAAWVVKSLYEDQSSPLRYRINRLGGRSREDKWIMQSELFNEIYRLVAPRKGDEDPGSLRRFMLDHYSWDRRGQAPALFFEFFRAAQKAMGDIWGNRNYQFTSSVTIKALVRVLGELMADEAVRKEWLGDPSHKVFGGRIAQWKDIAHLFKKDGFYQNFAAKGQLERVRVIKLELMRRVAK